MSKLICKHEVPVVKRASLNNSVVEHLKHDHINRNYFVRCSEYISLLLLKMK